MYNAFYRFRSRFCGVGLLWGALLLPSFAWDYATYPNEVLESWEFNDAAGTPMKNVANSAGNATWNTDLFSTDGSGNLVIANAKWQRNRAAWFGELLPPGLFEVKWHFSSVDLNNSTATDNCGVMFNLSSRLDVQLYASGISNLALFVKGPDGRHVLRTFNERTISNLTVRAVYDTVQNTAVVYFKVGEEAEQQSETYPTYDYKLQYVKGEFHSDKMVGFDCIKIDYLTFTMLDIDSDRDGIYDQYDPDDDNDGYDDTEDAFPLDSTEWADEDGNGVGDHVQFDQSVLDEFYNKFGVILSPEEHDMLAKAVKPYIKEAWRTNAEARIESVRKADLALNIVDAKGHALSDAKVHVDLRKKKFLFGAALPVREVTGNRVFSGISTKRLHELILDFCDSVGAINAFKPRSHHWSEGLLPDFVQWAKDNELPVRGHLLMWPSKDGAHLPYTNPYDLQGALETTKADPSQENVDALRELVDFQIADWAGKFKVAQWDVLNEVTDGNCFSNFFGEHCIVDWFTNAADHVVDSSTGLFLNDYAIIANSRSIPSVQSKVARWKKTIEYLQANNAPLTGLGLQSHFGTYHVPPEEIYARLDEAAAYGLNLVATEFDFAGTIPDVDKVMRTTEVMMEYFSHSSVSQFVTWQFVNDVPQALIGADGIPHLHGLAWYYLTRMLWNTDTNLVADASGSASVRAFKGTYDITVTYGGKEYVSALDLDSNGTFTVTLPDVGLGDFREKWRFGDAKGTPLSQTSNSKGSAAWSSTAFSTDGRGNLVLQSDGGDQYDISAPIATLTDGKYEMKWRIVDLDLSRTEATNACGLAFSLGDLLEIRLYTTENNGIQLTSSDGRLLHSFGRTLKDLTIRVVYDLNTLSAEVYSRLGSAQEKFEGRFVLNSSGVADKISAQMLAANMGDGDYLKLDYLSLRWLSPDSLYDDWAGQFAVGGATNGLADPDGDHIPNLAEYALGSNPASPSGTASRLSQKFQTDANDHSFKIVYARRKDAASRGLTYRIVQSHDLTSNAWSNANPVVEGTAPLDSDFESVTNQVPVSGEMSPLFIRLEVTFSPRRP